MAKKTTALARVQGNEGGLVVASWMKESMEKARNVASIFRTGVPRITHRQAQIFIDGAPVKDNKLPVIVIEAAFEKCFYSKGFKADEKATPDCYSFHAADKPAAEAHVEMAPHEGCKEKQNDRCAGCKHNRFGTAVGQDGSKGKGKRCSDKIRLLCISPSGDSKSLLKQQVRIFSVPANSLGNWGEYVGKLADMGILPGMVVTQVGTMVVPPPGQGYKITFEAMSTVDEEMYKVISGMQERALQTLTMPYPTLGSEVDGETDEESEADKKANAKRRAKVKA